MPVVESPELQPMIYIDVDNNKGSQGLGQEFGEEAKDMDIGNIYLEGIEKSSADQGKGYVPQEQVILLKALEEI